MTPFFSIDGFSLPASITEWSDGMEMCFVYICRQTNCVHGLSKCEVWLTLLFLRGNRAFNLQRNLWQMFALPIFGRHQLPGLLRYKRETKRIAGEKLVAAAFFSGVRKIPIYFKKVYSQDNFQDNNALCGIRSLSMSNCQPRKYREKEEEKS